MINHIQKRIVVTMSIGDNPFDEVSHPLFRQYAKKVGAEFGIINKEKYFIRPTERCPKSFLFEKLQLKEYLDNFDRVLFLDSDILINVALAPDIFSIVEYGYVGVLYEDIGNRRKNRRNLMFELQNELGDIGWRSGYINSGVMVFDKNHKNLFDFQLKESQVISNVAMSDQDLININVKKHRYPVQGIGYKFNHMSMFTEMGYNHLQSYFIHYAGRGFDKRLLRVEQMRRDRKIISTKNRFQRTFIHLYPRARLIAIGILNLIRSFFSTEKDFAKVFE